MRITLQFTNSQKQENEFFFVFVNCSTSSGKTMPSCMAHAIQVNVKNDL